MPSPGDRISGEQTDLAIKCLRAASLHRRDHSPEHIAGALDLPTAAHARHAVWLGEKLSSFDIDAAATKPNIRSEEVTIGNVTVPIITAGTPRLSPEEVRLLVERIYQALMEQAKRHWKLKEQDDKRKPAPEA